MDSQLHIRLKAKLAELAAHGPLSDEVQRNVLKEELQYYVLSFIYHHPQYRTWIMYGGSALRICHKLNRMSVDLDFEIAELPSDQYLDALKAALAEHFRQTYTISTDVLSIKVTHGRGLTLRFSLSELLGATHRSTRVDVKIDLNQFVATQETTEQIPVNRDQLSFVITTYSMSTLMASKIAAIFLRGQRGVGAAVYQEKGRDIYDLLWYMEQRVIPNLDYLRAKGIEARTLADLFAKLTLKMNAVSDVNLEQDLTPLFLDRGYIQDWVARWLPTYFQLIERYEIRTATDLEAITIHGDFFAGLITFVYQYKTEEGRVARVTYRLSEYWLEDREGEISIPIDETLVPLMQMAQGSKLNESLQRYATLFARKTEAYFAKNGRVVSGSGLVTKLIRMTADKLDRTDQIVLNRSTLLLCELDDLLK